MPFVGIFERSILPFCVIFSSDTRPHESPSAMPWNWEKVHDHMTESTETCENLISTIRHDLLRQMEAILDNLDTKKDKII